MIEPARAQTTAKTRMVVVGGVLVIIVSKELNKELMVDGYDDGRIGFGTVGITIVCIPRKY
jgi:hypothetical protein